MENLESHGMYYDFNFQAWKVMEFIMLSIFRPGKSWNLSEGRGKSWKAINMLSENKKAKR